MLAVDDPADLPLTENEEEQGATDGFLAIEDLLDFSNDDIGGPIDSSFSSASACTILPPSISPPDAASVCSIVSSPSPSPKLDKRASQQVAANAFDSDELCVPCDDLAELEWLSNFVEESFSSNDHLPANFCLGSIRPEEPKTQSMSRSFHSSSPVSVLESITAHSLKLNMSVSPSDSLVPARARSKRCRSAVCFWNTRILSAEASESILESSSTASTITAASSDSDGLPAYYDGHEDDDDYEEDENDNEEHDDIDLDHFRQYNQHKRVVYPSCKVKKFNKLTTGCMPKPKKTVKVVADDRAVPSRKCLHCGSTKTPQWRAGPMGLKTLCNACGVRYKSGRLCAEYRPAASPTFNESVHSNSHRKVLEMRRQSGELSSPIIAHHKLPARFDNAQLAKTKEDVMTTAYEATLVDY